MASGAYPVGASGDGVSIGAADLTVGLPAESDLGTPKNVDGVLVYRNADEPYSVAVNPVVGGAQFITVLAGAEAPTEYAYAFEAGEAVEVVLTEDGGARLIDRSSGEVAAIVERPWAFDAGGRAVATRFAVTGDGQLTQVIDHRMAGIEYPVVADPSVKTCDWLTAVCTTYTKAETRRINDLLFISMGAAVGTLCGQIPSSKPLHHCGKGDLCRRGGGTFLLVARHVQLGEESGQVRGDEDPYRRAAGHDG